jgi:hypothetical protein
MITLCTTKQLNHAGVSVRRPGGKPREMLAVKDPDIDPDPAFQVNPDPVSDPG